MSYAAGERFGNYEVTGVIGAGGMGTVYRAVHPELGRVVAIKVLRPELASDESAVSRFFDEARAANAIRHEGIVDISDFGRHTDGTAYYVMEHLAGEDLGQLLRRAGRFPPARAVALTRQVCGPLGAAHRRGIIHRDLKPQNLFVVRRGGEERIKVLDFGVAKLLAGVRHARTTAGVVLGTVEYMSPEQARADPVDGRSDIYSLGCILYEMLCGDVPIEGPSPVSVLARVATVIPRPPSERAPDAAIPPALDRLVMRALAKDAAERYSDTEDLDAALAAIERGGLPSAEPARDVVDPIAPTMRTVSLKTPAPVSPRETPPPAELQLVDARSAGDGGGASARAPTPPAVETSASPSSGGARRAPASPSGNRGSAFSPGSRSSDPGAPRLVSTDDSGALRTGDRAANGSPTTETSRSLARDAAQVSSRESARLLAEPGALLDSDSERRIYRIAIVVCAVFFGAAVLLYFLPHGVTALDPAALRIYLPIYGVVSLQTIVLLEALVRTPPESRLRWYLNRTLSFSGVITITGAIHLHGTLTSYNLLFYPMLVTADYLRGGRALARLTLGLTIGAFTAFALLEHFHVIGYAPFFSVGFSRDIVNDRAFLATVVATVAWANLLAYLTTNFLVQRVYRREHELRELGLGLAGRLEQQLELLRRSESLRAYVSPQLAELILRGDATGVSKHERRRITMVRIDCPPIARAAETVEPEEFAQLLNALFGRMADLAVGHGGSVDRFAGAEMSVLFGAPHSKEAASDALDAIRFALAAVAAVRELTVRCEAAGMDEPPHGRAAIHTGFATVGSFGSPTRLEYTAVGPHVEAVSALLQQSSADGVLISHPTYVLVRDQVSVELAGEGPLPGARHPVKHYRVTAITDSAAASSTG